MKVHARDYHGHGWSVHMNDDGTFEPVSAHTILLNDTVSRLMEIRACLDLLPSRIVEALDRHAKSERRRAADRTRKRRARKGGRR